MIRMMLYVGAEALCAFFLTFGGAFLIALAGN